LYRWKISNAIDDDVVLSEQLRSHLLKCGACREFFNSSVSIAERLAEQAVVSSPEIPPRLRRRIVSTISVKRRMRTERASTIRLRVAAACMLLAAVLGLAGIAVLNRGRESMPAADVGDTLKDVFATGQLAEEDLTVAIPSFLERPVSGELRNLADGTESAVQFLLACVTVDNPMPQPDRPPKPF
jgi:predicted anti-sigma-YlaC factor YlaD